MPKFRNVWAAIKRRCGARGDHDPTIIEPRSRPRRVDARRSGLISTAATVLGALAYSREAENDLWVAVGDLRCIWGHDGEVALLARLVLCGELPEMVICEAA